MTKAITLESNRLRLEKLSLAHLSKGYVSWMNDSEVYQFLESGGNYTMTDLNSFLKAVEKKDIYFWAVVLKNQNKHIGNIKIDPINEKHRFGQYGIMMGDKSEWGKGYAKEASEIVIRFCFKQLNLRKIILGVRCQNISAIKLYERLGFKIEGRYIKHVVTENGYDDVLRMAKFNDTY